ncbi:unnamed protein product [Nippostrongylus brasiliensis]|uniref:FRY n=1 Tax=Nippostrongylus brasiliensis TaxID=27835 RepID=A0A0N4YUG0_NIPBR|nr:unnamed protein product [Nippostrongylus brasiliensis]
MCDDALDVVKHFFDNNASKHAPVCGFFLKVMQQLFQCSVAKMVETLAPTDFLSKCVQNIRMAAISELLQNIVWVPQVADDFLRIKQVSFFVYSVFVHYFSMRQNVVHWVEALLTHARACGRSLPRLTKPSIPTGSSKLVLDLSGRTLTWLSGCPASTHILWLYEVEWMHRRVHGGLIDLYLSFFAFLCAVV